MIARRHTNRARKVRTRVSRFLRATLVVVVGLRGGFVEPSCLRAETIVFPAEPSRRAAVVVIDDDEVIDNDETSVRPIPSVAPNASRVRRAQVAVAEPNQPDDPLTSGNSLGAQFDREQFQQQLSEPSTRDATPSDSSPLVAKLTFPEKESGTSFGTTSSVSTSAANVARPTVAQGSSVAVDVAPPSAAPATDTVRWSEVPVIGSDDAGSLLQQSSDIQTVRNQRRSPVSFDPRVRGFKSGQIYTQGDGTWWTPVRTDLDTMLSKIDPGLLEQVTVIPGPYGLRYGPGLAFLHVQTTATPRYDNGFQSHARTGITVHPNGGQVFGRATVYGGNENWGYIFNHGNRRGNDYETGDGSEIPASYHNANYWGQLGFDLDDESRVEFRYGHLDQTDTQYAGQLFDINALGTDSFSATFLSDQGFRRFKVEGWYNETDYNGDTDHPGKTPTLVAADQPAFNVINRIEFALANSLGAAPSDVDFLGVTRGRLASSGARAVMTRGESDSIQWSIGSDIRYVQQRIGERFDITVAGANPQPIDPIDTNLPKSDLIDAGTFTELQVPVADWWEWKFGARTDTVHTDVDERLRENTSLLANTTELDQHDTLYAIYATSDAAITDFADVRLGAGHAQRPPTLTERYADGVFLGIIQNGFSRVIGNPALKPERSWQVDMTLDVNRPHWRSRLSGYQAWVSEYITYEGNLIEGPEGARLLVATNTDLATLAGFEAYSELDLLARVTAFSSISFIEGRDRTLDAALPGMYPLEGTVGLRFVNDPDDRRFGVEFGARIVDNEDRLGKIRTRGSSTGGLVIVEQATPGFTVLYLRSYWNARENLNLVAGIDNLGDVAYLEHLNLRLPAEPAAGIPELRVLSPGLSSYFGAEWTF